MLATLPLFSKIRSVWVLKSRMEACFERSTLLVVDTFEEFELFEGEDLVVFHFWVVIPFTFIVGFER